MSTKTELFNSKLELIQNSEIGLKKTITKNEKWLFKKIILEVIPLLTVKNGVIENSLSNINILTNEMNKVFKQFDKAQNVNIVKQLLKDFTKISTVNSSYFSAVTELGSKEFDVISKTVETLMQRSLGYTSKGIVKPNTFISSLTNTDSVNKTLKEYIIKNIQGGIDQKRITKGLNSIIKTDDNGLGILNKQYKEVVQDKYAQYERAESKAFADSLGMKAFVYSGGRVDDTRKFCCQRNRKVFLRSEAKEWSSIRFQGKNKGYSPLIDLGGYNCRHSVQWINNREAIRKRKDLMENDNGELVINPEQPKQHLNQC